PNHVPVLSKLNLASVGIGLVGGSWGAVNQDRKSKGTLKKTDVNSTDAVAMVSAKQNHVNTSAGSIIAGPAVRLKRAKMTIITIRTRTTIAPTMATRKPILNA